MPNNFLFPPTMINLGGDPCKFCGDVAFEDPAELAKHEHLCRIAKNLDPSGKPIRVYRKKVPKTVGEISFTGGTKEDPFDLSAALALFECEGEGSEKNKVQDKKKNNKEKKKEKEKKNKVKEEEEDMKNQKDDKGKGEAKNDKGKGKMISVEKEVDKGKGKMFAEEKKDKGKGIVIVESANEKKEVDKGKGQMFAEEKKDKGKGIVIVESANEKKEESENIELNRNKIMMFSEFAKTSVEDALAFLMSHNFDLNEALLAYMNTTKKN